MASAKPTLAAFWYESKMPLTDKEKKSLLRGAYIQAIHPSKLLLRDQVSGRIIAIVDMGSASRFCALCKNKNVEARFAHTCPHSAVCRSHKKK